MYFEILILGIFLWADVHWMKRLMPNMRKKMDTRLGAGAARGIISVLILCSIVMMVIGFRRADFIPIYTPFEGVGPVNNFLMVIAVMCMGMGASKGKMRTWLRHPMLTGVIIWMVAHLLVNGDLASLILFGGIGFWAAATMVLINRAEGAWLRPEAGPPAGDIRLVVITIIMFTVIASIHILLGYNPFSAGYA